MINRTILLVLLFVTILSSTFAQNEPVTEANYRLAERFSPEKIKKMVFSTSVYPNWLETGDRFWYSYKTSEGTSYYLVDLNARSKKALFDNDKMAAELSRITKDPYDGQHLPPIRLRFRKNDTVFQFDVTSSQDEKKKEEDEEDTEEEKDTDEEKKDEDIELEKEKEDDKDGDKEDDKDKELEIDEEEIKDGEKKEEKKEDEKDLEKDKEEDKDGEKKEENKKGDKKKDKKKEKTKKKVFHFEFNIKTGVLSEIEGWKEEKKRPKWANIAPDSSKVVFARDYNLYWMDKENFLKAIEDDEDSTIVEHQLSTEGVKNYSFGGGYTPKENDDSTKIKKESKKRRSAWFYWSPDSKYFSLTRHDSRHLKALWVINVMAEPRPDLETYKYQMPGDKENPKVELWVFDMDSLKGKQIDIAAFNDQTVSILGASRSNKERLPDFVPSTWLSKSSDKIYFTRASRDLHKIDVCVADAVSGEVKTLIEERLNTYVEVQKIRLVDNGKELIHWSERDGWAHFYLYDGKGNLKNQITSGAWHCERIAKVDEKNRVLYFTANGYEKDENPYYYHLYRINFDGTGMKLLNKGDYNHSASMSDSYRYFINNYSRVNSVPTSEIRDKYGKVVMQLEQADLRNLFAAGYKFPEPFVAKADDGVTDIYGVMYKPFDFDTTRKYPILEYVYPGPFSEAVNISFSSRMDRTDRFAQLGFIVITLGNRGGHPDRSKWYHNYGYGDLRDYGLADKKYVVEQLADRHGFIDIEKVGISGHSGGGFMSTAALLQYPDFYKAAVSSAGNHENNIYNRWWSEKHHGIKEIIDKEGKSKFIYDIEKNTQLAKNLRGNLLLVTGDMDNNVHPGNTYRMANALIKAKKRFDFFVMPGQRHGFGQQSEYFFWLKADYFCKHLIGDYSISTDIFEMRREHKMTPSKARSK